jgi:hypothetical protein
VGDGSAEAGGEGLLLGIVEVVLIAEEDHLVAQQRCSDLSDGGGVELAGQSYAVDAGADAAAQLGHGQC